MNSATTGAGNPSHSEIFLKFKKYDLNKNLDFLYFNQKIKKNFLYNYAAMNNNNITNEISSGNTKTYYVPNFHKILPKICEDYKSDYNDYLKTTGAFFIPNVFLLYDEVVNRLTNEIFEECFLKSLKELDDMAINIVQKEVENDK